MTTKWQELKHKATPETRKRLKQEALSELDEMERAGIGFIRTARQQTQVAVAEQMKIPQSAVSRLEGQQDFLLSTLRKYVSALGGKLELKAVFPDDTVDLERLVSSGKGAR